MATFPSDPTIITDVTKVRVGHISEARSEYKRVESAVTFNPAVNTLFTDAITANTIKVRKIHMDELRSAINNLESKFSNNCNCLSPSNCCQTAPAQCTQSCQTTPAQCTLSQCSQTCQSQCINCNCDCNCCGDCGDCGDCGSCVLKGSQILMTDGSYKSIEDIQAGDKIVGLTGINTVLEAPHFHILGPRRSVMKFATGSPLRFTSDHLFWINRDGWEFWGVHDFNFYLGMKMRNYHGFVGITKNDPIVIWDSPFYAHIEGWRRETAIIDRSYDSNTTVITLKIDGDHTMIADGYVIAGMLDDTDFEYSVKWNGLK